MAFVRIPGSAGRYRNTVTGETISRRQYIKLTTGSTPEQIAKINRARDLEASLARPAPGRTKATNKDVIEARKQEFIRLDNERSRRQLERQLKAKAKKGRVKKIRKQLLKAGKRAARIPFWTYSDYLLLRQQCLDVKLPNGRRLITSWAIGIEGLDERDGKLLTATLWPLMSPSVLIDENEFEAEVTGFLEGHSYFLLTNYFAHLHFDTYYAEEKSQKTSRQRRIF